MKKLFIFTALAGTLFGCSSPENKSFHYPSIPVNYPQTKKIDQVDDYHGTQVADPYRWLEDDLSDETASWVEAQNQVTFGYLEQIPFREKIHARLEKLWNYEKVGSPCKEGNYFYFYKNDGLQNQFVLYRTMESIRKRRSIY